MRVALVDDNKNDLALLHEYISEIFPNKPLTAVR